MITYEGDEAKGSGRSLDGFSLYDCIASATDLLTHFGGHMLAAGFGIQTKDIAQFKSRVNQYAKTVEMPFPTVNVDCRLRPSFISAELLPVISLLEPFGAGNPQPTFGLFDMKLLSVQGVGGDGAAACRVLMSIDILKELGILSLALDGRIEAVEGAKAELDSSPLLRQLRSLCNQ